MSEHAKERSPLRGHHETDPEGRSRGATVTVCGVEVAVPKPEDVIQRVSADAGDAWVTIECFDNQDPAGCPDERTGWLVLFHAAVSSGSVNVRSTHPDLPTAIAQVEADVRRLGDLCRWEES